jgi:uncharacterized protein YgbK (DUF1537 family)
MTRFAIIADDLSSATDCGAQVVRSGMSVVVPLGNYSLPAQARTADVISIDTDSRSLSANIAYAKVKKAAQQLVADGWTQFYKSVDSTLRGNLGAEIEAVMDVVQPDCAIIAPAFPKYERTTVNGVQYLRGRPLHETEFGTDPTAPVKDANIARRLAEGSTRKVGRLTLEQLRSGFAEIQMAVQELRQQGNELIVVNIAEQEDLQRICLGLSQSDLRIIWVGSTGLAEFVPLAFGVSSTEATSHQNHKIDSRPALALVGSASETTREQLHVAQTNHGLNIIYLDSARLIQNDSSELEEANSKLRAAIHMGHDVALAVRSSREEIAATQRMGATLNLSAAQVAQQIVDTLAKLACHLIHKNQISGIVATGGDTANALCNALSAQALEILGEVEAGIPVMRVVGDQSIPLVTKAGGFGSPAAIQDALMKVKQYA